MSSRNRRVWRQDEDQALIQLIDSRGIIKWGIIAENLQILYGFRKRTGKQCRERWYNQLSPNLQRGDWSMEQQIKIFELHSVYGNCWIKIAYHLPGRTDNAIKNVFYSIIRKALRKICRKLGVKNSTLEVGAIKPITLSKIFAHEIEWGGQTLGQQSIKEIQRIKQKCVYIKQEILKFSNIFVKGVKIYHQPSQSSIFDISKYKQLLAILMELNDRFSQQERIQKQRLVERQREKLLKLLQRQKDKEMRKLIEYKLQAGSRQIKQENQMQYFQRLKIQENQDNSLIYNYQNNEDNLYDTVKVQYSDLRQYDELDLSHKKKEGQGKVKIQNYEQCLYQRQSQQIFHYYHHHNISMIKHQNNNDPIIHYPFAQQTQSYPNVTFPYHLLNHQTKKSIQQIHPNGKENVRQQDRRDNQFIVHELNWCIASNTNTGKIASQVQQNKIK